MKHLLSVVETYRVETDEEVEQLYAKLKVDPCFSLTSFAKKVKNIKEKGEIVGTYNLVSVKKIFDEEKDPCRDITVSYSDGVEDEDSEGEYGF